MDYSKHPSQNRRRKYRLSDVIKLAERMNLVPESLLCNKPLGNKGRTCTKDKGHEPYPCEGPPISQTKPVTVQTKFYDTKHNCPTLDRAKDDEPIFVVKGSDLTSAAVIQAWLSLNPGITEDKRERAITAMKAMNQWPKKKQAD